MKRLLLASAVFLFCHGVASAQGPRALLDQYCVSCHNEKTKTAGLMLDKLDPARVSENREAWEKVVQLAPDSPEAQAAKRALDSLRSAHPGGGPPGKPGA